MVSCDAIGWGSYREYEGPLYWGVHKYQLPAVPTDGEKVLMVITTTEGGTYDAYNGYDKCICTSGLIQWCDRAPFFLVTKLLGAVQERDPTLVYPVLEFAQKQGYSFGRREGKGPYRFFDHSGGVVNTAEKQRRLYFGNSAAGKKGTFSVRSKVTARRWAAACSSVWQYAEAQKVQRDYTVPRLYNFATKTARPILSAAEADGGDVGRAFCAAYLSYAANNPKRASDALSWLTMNRGIEWTKEWLHDALRALVFRPGVAIYPHRYDRIRPVIESLYGVDLPDVSNDLPAWKRENGFKGTLDTADLQRALMAMGYDVGTAGADGRYGEKTRRALMDYEVDAGVPERFRDGYPDKVTIAQMERTLASMDMELTWR